LLTSALSMRLLSLKLDSWSIGVLMTALMLSLPMLVVLSYLFEPSGEIWRHLAATVLQDYVTNSLLLMLGVAIGVLLLGVSTAWLTSMCQFPGRALFEWALLLPMMANPHWNSSGRMNRK